MTCRFCICEFTYLLNFTCNLKSFLRALSFADVCMWRVVKMLFPAEVNRGNTLPSCFSIQTRNNCPFHGLFSAMLFVFCFVLFLCFLLVIVVFKWALKHGTETLYLEFLSPRSLSYAFRRSMRPSLILYYIINRQTSEILWACSRPP